MFPDQYFHVGGDEKGRVKLGFELTLTYHFWRNTSEGKTSVAPCYAVYLSLPKMLSGANAFEISDIERMNIRAH